MDNLKQSSKRNIIIEIPMENMKRIYFGYVASATPGNERKKPVAHIVGV